MKTKKNKYGHIVEGNVNIKKLWIARDVIVTTLNRLRIMLLGMEDNQNKRGIEMIEKKLSKGLNKIQRYLGIPNKSKEKENK